LRLSVCFRFRFIIVLPFQMHRRPPRTSPGWPSRQRGERRHLLLRIATALRMSLRQTHVSRGSRCREGQTHLVMPGDPQLIHRHLLCLNSPLNLNVVDYFIRHARGAPAPEHVNSRLLRHRLGLGGARTTKQKGRLGFPRRPSESSLERLWYPPR